MTKAPAGNGTQSKNYNLACPNANQSGHTSTASWSVRLTPARVRRALETIDIQAGSRLARCASYRAFTAHIDADDLLQEAILRTMTSRTCPAHIAIEHFLMGVMRSIASKVIEKRERAGDAQLECGRACSNTPVAPYESLVLAERADMCRRSVEKVVAGSPTAEIVVDGIGQGLCGKALADFAGIDQIELASTRRMNKRRVAIVWGELEELDEAA